MSKLLLKPEVKTKWLEALRSGDYKQAKGTLRKINQLTGEEQGFCCLGVLCNLHAQEHPEFAAKQKDPFKYHGATAAPPLIVLDWAFQNFRDHDNLIPVMVAKKRRTLAELNDRQNPKHAYDFNKIADVIEEQL